VLVACTPAPPPPNVILIVVDALRADHLAHYGYPRPTSAGLDAFAAQATRFSDCQAPAPWTNPSVASLFTGLHPERHRNNPFGAALSPDLDTLAETVRAAGWRTAAISFNPGIRSELAYDQGFDEFDEFLGRSADYPDTEEMVARVGAWLERRPEGPFFLYLQPMNVHGPYRVPKEHQGVLLGRPPSREFRYYQGYMHDILRNGKVELRPQVPKSYVESLVDKYDTAVRYTTDQLDLLFTMLDRADLFRDALIIVTADHGEELFDHGGFSHGYTLHREVLHVPLYIKLPGQTEGGVEGSAATLMDIMPTILDVLDIPVDRDFDGRSLLPLLEGRAEPGSSVGKPRLYQVAWRGRCKGRAIADDGLKLIEIESNYEGLQDVVRLYDEQADPGETADLSSERTEAVDRLRAELARLFKEAAARAVAPPENRLNQLDEDRLKALGYIE
jgi:arylsulfatase A-like enzyme